MKRPIPKTAGDVAPVILRYQPEPAACIVSWMPASGGLITAITRVWADGDEKRCRLCPACHSSRGACQIQVRGFVSDDDAPLFSIVECDNVDSGERAPRLAAL